MAQFSVHEAKTHLSKLIAAAVDGGEVVIARGSVPVVRLVPVEAPAQRRFGALRGKIAIDAGFDEPLPEDELGGWGA
jgi:prevent-host-death family protein